MNIQELYQLSKGKLVKQSTRKFLNCDTINIYTNGSVAPVVSVPCSSKISSALDVNNFLKKNGREDLLRTVIGVKCIVDTYRAGCSASSFLVIEGVWYIIPSNISQLIAAGNAVKREKKRPINKNFYGRDCTTYGQCPACGYAVKDGMGGTDNFCGRCRQPIDWN